MIFLAAATHMVESAILAKMTVAVISIILLADGVVSGWYGRTLAGQRIGGPCNTLSRVH